MHDQLIKGNLRYPGRSYSVYFDVGLLCDKHKFGFAKIHERVVQKFFHLKEKALKTLYAKRMKPSRKEQGHCLLINNLVQH
ncbi:hypothetical protein PHSC3_001076 [Chlamydiales bacterium STE3]|nr:hypothetical protein PHSC3_001076 [Chlamydiales bacterium STE3]